MPRVDLDTYTPPAPALIDARQLLLRGYASDCVSVAHAEPSGPVSGARWLFARGAFVVWPVVARPVRCVVAQLMKNCW